MLFRTVFQWLTALNDKKLISPLACSFKSQINNWFLSFCAGKYNFLGWWKWWQISLSMYFSAISLSQFSCSVVSKCLQPLGLHQTRLPCPSLSPRVCSNSCPFKSVMPSNHLIFYRPLLPLPSTFPSIRVFSSESAVCIRWPRYWSISFSISPSNEYWFPLELTSLISLLSKGLSRVFSSTTVQNHQFFSA